ncbi:MAG: hypothetical protein MR384_10265 [Lachnospiraceae bacterium]|nr:hypothetical protein [Lachnospiraceae bacterium]
MIRPAPDIRLIVNDESFAETGNQSAYNITVLNKYYNEQKASSIIRTEMPKYLHALASVYY